MYLKEAWREEGVLSLDIGAAEGEQAEKRGREGYNAEPQRIESHDTVCTFNTVQSELN